MGRLFVVQLEGRSFRCRRCGTHLALASDLESKARVRARACVRERVRSEGQRGLCATRSSPVVAARRGTLTLTLAAALQKFQCRTGKAFLFGNVVNVRCGRGEERSLITGRHLCADTSCLECGEVVGWMYIEAMERSQKYKEGAFLAAAGSC